MNTSIPEQAVTMVLEADSYMDVFGIPEAHHDVVAFVRQAYRRFQRDVHPDRFQDEAQKQRATTAFTRLSAWFNQALRAAQAGQYGAEALAMVRTKRAEHEVLKKVATGDISVAYRTQTTLRGGERRTGFMKVASSPRDGDLMVREAQALKRLRGPDTDPRSHPYVSELLDSFVYFEAGKPRRQTTVLALLEGFYSLEVVRERCGGAVRALHVAWMWRRLLWTLGSAHDAGVVHGAVLPPHVMILPEQHGLTLVDWCYASLSDTGTYAPLTAIVDQYRDWYPPEVFAKASPSPATDLYLAAMTMVWLLGGEPKTATMPQSVPKQLRAFFKGCLLQSQAMRPQNAWLLLQEFDELLETMGGPFFPRRFRPFILP